MNVVSTLGRRITSLRVVRNARLAWRLMRDPRTPRALKIIPPAAIIYLISPFDLVPDIFLGPGHIDDIAVIVLGVWLFIRLCPKFIVDQHLEEMDSVAASYRVKEDEPAEEEPGGETSGYLEGPSGTGR